MNRKIPIPYISGDYSRIYAPQPDVYLGPDTANNKNGTLYENWTTNDFSVAHDGDKWYLTGITHPTPWGLLPDGFHYDGSTVHEAEYQLFLSESEGNRFAEVVNRAKCGWGFRERPKLLWPSQRPDERYEAHAPHLMKWNDGWRIVYGPVEMRAATFDKDFNLIDRTVLFTDESSARDPYVFFENGVWTLFYCVEHRIQLRRSEDFVHWSDPVILQENPFNAAPESPFVMKRDGFYYLFWAIFDSRNGSYDQRTFVFAADTIEGITGTAPIAILDGHAPEIVSDESGDWILSVFYPENGVNAAPLGWH